MVDSNRLLREALDGYEDTWLQRPFFRDESIPDQCKHLARFRELIVAVRDPFARTARPGHITGSAFVVDAEFERVLLTLHGKLNLWLQLGGHADDGQTDVSQIAMREAGEESGLAGLRFLPIAHLFARSCSTPIPFDLDVHAIPAFRDETAHYHYDISYVLIADRHEPLRISDESHDLRWFNWEEASEKCDLNVRRGVMKLQALKNVH